MPPKKCQDRKHNIFLVPDTKPKRTRKPNVAKMVECGPQEKSVQGDDPLALSSGTEVSAKYKGAFCEARISKVVRTVKCKVTFKNGLGTTTVLDTDIKGTVKAGSLVEANHPTSKQFGEAIINKITDASQYTVVFDDGDITTLRRSALCLKSGRHFNESETLDQLPLTHPEHFGNPVIGARGRGRRSKPTLDESDCEDDSQLQLQDDDDNSRSNNDSNFPNKEDKEIQSETGKVVWVETLEKQTKKKDGWFPGVIVAPSAQTSIKYDHDIEYLVRSFKDARYYSVPKDEVGDFNKTLYDNDKLSAATKIAIDKAWLFLEQKELPPHWDKHSIFGDSAASENDDTETDRQDDKSDEETLQQNDLFIAHLYKFMDDCNTPLDRYPEIEGEEVNFYKLYNIVGKLGGHAKVTASNLWKKVTRNLRLRAGYGENACSQVKSVYKKYLANFEDIRKKLGCTMLLQAGTSTSTRGVGRKQKSTRGLGKDKDRSTPPQTEKTLVKSEKDDEEKDKKPSQSIEEEKKRDAKKETLIKDEDAPLSKIKKKEQMDDSASGGYSDINNEGEESSCSEKSQKSMSRLTPCSTISNRSRTSRDTKETKRKLSQDKKKSETSKRQDKKEDKSKEEDNTKTRSKITKDDPHSKLQKTNTEARESRISTCDTDKKTLAGKQKKFTDEELKKRGRKKKEVETGKNLLSADEDLTQHYKGPVAMGDRLKVIYGPNQDQKITYEAKVVDIECNNPDNNPSYLVHYTGWNTRYDEWIKIDRIALNYSQQGSGRSKKPNKDKNTSQIRPQTPGSTPRTSKVSASANTSSLPGMSSRRRIQNDSSASNSNKDSRKDDREITLATTRSGTPSPLISRTKSPASTGRPTRMTRNLTEVSEGRGSRKRLETDDSDSSDSDGSDSPVIPIKPRRRNCETREARKRAESRMKVDENSDIDEDKEIEEPRRGRRSRRTATKMTEIKSEPESETEQPKGCEFDLNQIRSELKGFDKAVKIEMSSTSTSQEQEEHAEEKTSIIVKEEKSELDEKKVSLDDDNKMSDKQETSTLPIKKDVVNTEAIPESTEDIYEFKEPEPFEFEVRNKRDSSGSDKTEKDSNKDLKDKSTAAPPASIVKKRPAEDDLKSPKKRLKTPASSSQLVAAATATKDSKADINRSTTPIETVVSADAKKKTTRKIFSKSDDTESTEGEESSSLTSLSPTKFYPSTSYPGATVIRRHKMSTDEDLGSSPHETATENIKNKRLLLNKTTSIKNVSDHKSEEQSVDEAKKKSIKPKSLDLDKGNKETKEIPSFYIPAKITETREDEQKTSIKKKMKSQDPPTLLETKKKQAVVRQTPTRKDHLSSGGESDSDIESISTRDPSKYFSQYSGPKTKAAAAIASEYESLNNKVDAQSGDKRIEPVQSIEKSQLNTSTTVTKSSNTEQKSDYTMGTPVSLTVPPPISARLPATATIEEKLSAAAVFHRRQMIESKKEEESKQDRKVAKEMPKKTHGVAFSATKKAEAKITPEPEKKKVEAPLIIPIKDPLQEIEIHTDPLLEIMKSKEEEQLKAKKSMEEQKTTTNVIKTYQRKEPPPKPEESWKKVTSTTVISDQLAAVTSTGRKEPFVSRIKTLERSESVDSTDSSDSERRLTIIDEDYTDETGPEQSKKSNHSEQSSLATSSAQRDLQADIINTMMQTKLVTKLDEDGENINSLLCEEEIPGSPTPGTDSHNEHQERSTSSNSQNIFKSDLGSKAAVAFVAAQLPLTIPSTTSVSTLVSSSLESLNASNGKSITSTASSTPVSVLTTTSTSHLYVTTVVTTTTGSTPPLTHLHQNQRRDSNVEPMEVDVAPVTIDFNTSSIPTQRVPTPALSLDSDSKKDSMEVDIDALNKSENPLTSTENVADDSKIKGAMKRTTSITSADEVENVSPKKRAKRSGVQQTSSSGPIKKSPRQNSKNRKSTTRSDTDDSDNEQVISQLPKAIRDLLTNVSVTPPRKLPDPTDYSKAPPPEFDSNAKIAYFTKQLNLIIKEYGEYKSVNSKVDRIRRKLKKKKSREAQKNKDDNEQPGTSQ